jgi:DNA-binding NarL/FixJ family response regulator
MPEAPAIIPVAVVEDDPVHRELLCSTLQRTPGMRLQGSYGSAEEAAEGLVRQPPAVVVTDINLPGQSGVDLVRRLSGKLENTQFLMLTFYQDGDTLFQALEAGAMGYLIKPVKPEELVSAVQDVCCGGAPMSGVIARQLVRSFQRPSRPEFKLSPREREVLDLLVEGRLYKEIADQLGVSQSAVRHHIEHIYKKLHVRSRSEAITRYLRKT